MIDNTTKFLFGRFPREVSNPSRWLVYNMNELEKFINRNDGVNSCYTSVYSSNYLIDKIFFDFDYGVQVLEDTKRVYKWCLDKEYPVIPVVSGKKGYHIYIIFKPRIYKEHAKLLLTKASYSILSSVFGKFRQESYYYPSGKCVQILRTEERIIGPDPTVCGDIRRVCRIPNTLRPPENKNYCTFLPPDSFLEMTEEDIELHMKTQHHYNYETDSTLLLTEFDYDYDDTPSWEPMSKSSESTVSNPSLFLRFLLRPCLYRHIIGIHPSHEVRVAATVDLLQNYNPETILEIYSTLGWEDYEEKLCYSQILSCGKYKPYSCSKLKALGIPNSCCVG